MTGSRTIRAIDGAPLRAVLAVLVLLLGLFAPALHEVGHALASDHHADASQDLGAPCAGCVAIQQLGGQSGLTDDPPLRRGEDPLVSTTTFSADAPARRTRSTSAAPRAPPAV